MPEGRRVLLVEPDAEMRRRVRDSLLDAGYRVDLAGDAKTAPAGHGPDVVIASLDWFDEAASERGLELARSHPGVPLVLLVDPSHVREAARWLGQGIEEFLLRPPDPSELTHRLRRILERGELDSRIAFFQDELSKKYGHRDLEAHSPAMRGVLERMHRVAPMRSTVLISGESGVGKELVARAIHFHSPRRDRPFIALNCAAISSSLIESELFGHEKGAFTGPHVRTRGKFEIADGGTLFLDEIGEMHPGAQAKLLRVLEEREFMRVGGTQSIHVDVRVIAATNADLERLVAESRFRQDLYYRLKVVSIQVPPLRKRTQDVPFLVHKFLDELARANAIRPKTPTPEALVALQAYHWPGNVRELKNVLESLLVAIPGDRIRVEDLPRAVAGPGGAAPRAERASGSALVDMERELIRRTLERTGGNRTHSAALLGIGVRTLQRKMRSFGIRIPSTRRRPRQARGDGDESL